MSNLLDFIGVARVPTELFLTEQIGAPASWFANIQDRVGAKLSSAITSATLTEVLNITTPGVLTFGGLISSTATTSSSSKIQIEVDGVNVTDESALSVAQTEFWGVVGSVFVQSSAFGATEGAVPFNSLRVLIAGDGTNGVQFAYKNYLT